MPRPIYRASALLPRLALALLAGVALATLWVNLSPATYYDVIEWRLLDLDVPGWIAPLPISLTPLTLVSEGLMALFIFTIGKELWEALVVEHGALKGRQALLPAGLVAGGAVGAVLVWILTGSLIETAEEAGFAAGWPVPLGSDVVLCYVVGRAVFGPGHPALHLLLLLAIAADILALLMLGLSQAVISPRLAWLLLPVLASLMVWRSYGRALPEDAPERQRQAQGRLLPYVLAGILSWIGVAAAGLPPVLGLLPVIPAIAHADRSFGPFAEAEDLLHDPLNRLTHALAAPLTVTLFLFGLTRGGLDLSALAPTTVTTLAALWIGKPLGILILGLGSIALIGQNLPAGVSLRDVLRIAVILGPGFTVPVLALDGALPGGAMQEAARLGLAPGLLVAALALALPRGRQSRA